jgi:hypothetical protein
MSIENVTTDEILDAIQRVPVQRWGEVMQAIESLQAEPVLSTAARANVRTGTDLQGSELIGIWADRTDVRDNHDFARDLRREAGQ